MQVRPVCRTVSTGNTGKHSIAIDQQLFTVTQPEILVKDLKSCTLYEEFRTLILVD